MQVPFSVVDGRIYVQVRVDGRGPYRFAVDTGASGIGRADVSLVAALGLRGRAPARTSDGIRTVTVDTVHLDELALGGLSRHGVDVIARDYGSQMADDARFSGILGRAFFGDGLLVIDYPKKTLSFSTKMTLPAGPDVLPYTRAFRVPVSIGTTTLQGNLDTGANVSFVLPQSLYARVAGRVLGATHVGTLTNSRLETRSALVHGPFRIGAVSLSDVEVRVSQRYPELLVGAHALQGFVLMIDQRTHRIALCAP
ncbi:hypothetical protein G7Y82_19885 [Solimonas sp. C16B3]|uniref:Aspartyl protease n=2 Tax=Solimonas marina TaxID=2714601 RepID=A0A970B839_9GAMM|nr:hypothetical protein [Solimonas marina]